MVVDEHAGELAFQEGLFLLAQSGETVALLNKNGFEPTAW